MVRLIKEMFLNDWFSAIINGAISSFIVLVITEMFLSSKNKKDKLKKIRLANEKIITLLKPYIAERNLPSYTIFNSIVVSISMEYAVELQELYTPIRIYQELIKEIVEDPYISIAEKTLYTEYLEGCIINIDKEEIDYKVENPEDNTNSLNNIKYKSEIINVFVGMSSFIVGLFLTLYKNYNSLTSFLYKNKFFLITTLFAMTVALKIVTLIIKKYSEK